MTSHLAGIVMKNDLDVSLTLPVANGKWEQGQGQILRGVTEI